MNEVAVSVFCIVYNHETTIERCLMSLLEQKTNFEYEIIVHDDHSTDKSVEIIKRFKNKYGEKLVTIFQEENQYSKGVSIAADILFKIAKGKYFAFCEGDDYWCDDRKLQVQYDYMENNPDVSLCAHNTKIHYTAGEKKDSTINAWENLHNLDDDDIFLHYSIQTSSFFIRSNIAKEAKSLTWRSRRYFFGDFIYITFAYSKGRVVCMPEIMSVYNVGDGISTYYYRSDMDKLKKAITDTEEYLKEYDGYTGGTKTRIINERVGLDKVSFKIYEFNRCVKLGDKKRLRQLSKEIIGSPYFKKWLDYSPTPGIRTNRSVLKKLLYYINYKLYLINYYRYKIKGLGKAE